MKEAGRPVVSSRMILLKTSCENQPGGGKYYLHLNVFIVFFLTFPCSLPMETFLFIVFVLHSEKGSTLEPSEDPAES